MKKLVVFDSESKEIHVYKALPYVHINEDIIDKLGFNINNCWWMFGEGIKLIEHREILTCD